LAVYHGPVCKLCRREGQKLFLKGEKCYTPKCVFEKRPSPPGQASNMRRRTKMSDYGVRLREKQKTRRIYGVMEKQCRRYVDRAERSPAVTGEALLQLLERRLDNVVFRLGFATSRAQARQLVCHRHVLINGRPTNIPSRLVEIGDIIEIKPRSQGLKAINIALELSAGRSLPEWLERDGYRGRVLAFPERSQIDCEVNEQFIVEYYSR